MTPDPETLARVQYEAALRQRASNIAWILRETSKASEAVKREAAECFLDDQRTLAEEGMS